MAETVTFELVSPERLLVSQPVEMVVVPGTEGYFGVLPGHAPVMTSLNPGVIDIYEAGAVAQRIFVAGGFAEVNEASCTVLAEEAAPLDSYTTDDARSRLQAAEQALAKAASDVDRTAAEAQITAAHVLLDALVP